MITTGPSMRHLEGERRRKFHFRTESEGDLQGVLLADFCIRLRWTVLLCCSCLHSHSWSKAHLRANHQSIMIIGFPTWRIFGYLRISPCWDFFLFHFNVHICCNQYFSRHEKKCLIGVFTGVLQPFNRTFPSHSVLAVLWKASWQLALKQTF